MDQWQASITVWRHVYDKLSNMAEKGPQVKIGHYILGETLGVGTFGKVKSEYLMQTLQF